MNLVLVINLNRRHDRLARISNALRQSHIAFERIEAVDGQEMGAASSSPILRSGEVACWHSHVKALRNFLDSDWPAALILEDDADVQRLTATMINESIQSMHELSVDVLQLGWIDHIYKYPSSRGVIDYVSALRSRRIKKSSSGGTQLVLGEFRAGSHAYLINRKAAQALVETNSPAMLAVDEYLGALAKNSFGSSKLQIGRSFECLIGQVSRKATDSTIDSDV
jgi:GR25 family glycosyltransferase involved in LPS biosynthesis